MIIKYNNTPIHYTVTGKGNPIVLLHGFLLSSSIWTEITPKLAIKNQVITIDLPGHGKSGVLAKVHTMELMAEVVNHILEELKLENVKLIGHSMGGYIALALVEKYPSKIETLVLLNSSSEADSKERKVNRGRAIKVIHNNSGIFIKMGIAALFSKERQEKFNYLIDKFSKEASLFPENGIIASIKGMKNRKDRTSILKSFKGKKYMIAGVEDPIIPISNSESIALISKTKLYKVNSGHMSVNENIDEIVKLMYFIDFL